MADALFLFLERSFFLSHTLYLKAEKKKRRMDRHCRRLFYSCRHRQAFRLFLQGEFNVLPSIRGIIDWSELVVYGEILFWIYFKRRKRVSVM